MLTQKSSKQKPRQLHVPRLPYLFFIFLMTFRRVNSSRSFILLITFRRVNPSRSFFPRNLLLHPLNNFLASELLTFLLLKRVWNILHQLLIVGNRDVAERICSLLRFLNIGRQPVGCTLDLRESERELLDSQERCLRLTNYYANL